MTTPPRSVLLFWITTLTLPASVSGQTLDEARARLSQIEGQLVVAGLDSAVEVRRDRWGVPHIYARTPHDLFFAQGLVAAQDRLWQMDIWRRTGEGRLSEILGPQYLERDRFARLLAYRGDMGAEWTSYAPDTRAIVSAFIAGVNAWIAMVRDNPPIEYSRLGFLPEPFAVEVPLQRMAALAMTGNATDEITRARLVALVGTELVEQLWPPVPYRALDPADGVDLAAIGPDALGATGAAYGAIRFPREGSNNWVVHGSRTATGKPLLANDPHRTLAVPSLRYLTHLVGPGWNVIGAGEPGVPGVAAGHNERIGFGFTIVGMDQQDVYVETLGRCPGAAEVRCYRYRDGWRSVRTRIDTIPIRGASPRIVRLEFTEHGPIVAEDTVRGLGYVIRFVGSEPGTAGYLAQLSINRATDWASFRLAAERWRLPTENLVYADVDGNIGWIAAGLMPVRHWSGMLPVPGTGGYEWQGFLDWDDLPSSHNPPSGFIVTANNNILPEGYGKPLNYEWASPFRAERLTEVLGSRTGWTRQDFERLQHDELSMPARRMVPLLLDAADRRGGKGLELNLLRRWDYVMAKDAAAPVVFAAWSDSLAQRYFADRSGVGRSLLRATLNEPFVLAALERPDASFGADPEAGRDRLLLESFEAAVGAVRAAYGSDPGEWHWGPLHQARFPHPAFPEYDLPSASRGGDGTTVNVTAGPGWRQTHGASFRQVLDLADWDNSVATSVPGQSGQPGSPFYGNLLPLWERGEYFPLVFSRGAVERETAHLLRLVPPGR